MALSNNPDHFGRSATSVLHGIRPTEIPASVNHHCVVSKLQNFDLGQQLSFIDLPVELRLQIYGLSLHRVPVRTSMADEGQRHHLIDPTNDPPPFFSCVCARDRRTAISLLLTSKRVNAEINALLFSCRRFEFLNLTAAWKLRAAIGTEKFNFIRNIEICGGWGDSDDLASVTRLRRLVIALPHIESLSLLWFECGVKDSQGRRATTRWSNNQLSVMTTVILANNNLEKIYHRNRYKQMRFCSGNIRKRQMEVEIDLKYEIAARKQHLVGRNKKCLQIRRL